jgi:uncharacterized BrkB/YihY/UPF0761 family membrane protein
MLVSDPGTITAGLVSGIGACNQLMDGFLQVWGLNPPISIIRRGIFSIISRLRSCLRQVAHMALQTVNEASKKRNPAVAGFLLWVQRCIYWLTDDRRLSCSSLSA